MDLEKYLIEYPNVSRRELERCRLCSGSDLSFETRVRGLQRDREYEKTYGKEALKPGLVVQLLSITLHPKQQDKPLSIYGRIYGEFVDSISQEVVEHDIYNRDRTLIETLDTASALTLCGPDYSCNPKHAFIPMFRTRFNVELFDADDNIFARGFFYLDDSDIQGGYEKVKSQSVPCQQGTLLVEYVAIPLGVYCRLELRFYNRKPSNTRDSINVNGKIVARFDKTTTDGNYDSQGCLLFHKQPNAFEKAEFDPMKMKLSTCWVSLPAYSALVLDVHLFEYETGQTIVNDTLKLLPRPGWLYGDSFILDDFFIEVGAAWFSPTPMRPLEGDEVYQPVKSLTNDFVPFLLIDEMDTDGEDESSSSSDDESDSSWVLRPHKAKPWPSPAVEIFSIFVGRDNSKEIQIHGSVDLWSDDIKICRIFKRDEKDALCLLKDVNTTPILDGSRVYEDFNPLEIKFDLKDLDGSLSIKGYQNYSAEVLDRSYFRDKQLCSFIDGQNGFAAVHYTIFSEAVGARIKVCFNLKKEGVDVHSRVYGSVISEYRGFDYSSRYHKDYYRAVLFTKTEDDLIQLNVDSSIPLSRSLIIVPSYSSLVLDVELSMGISGPKLSCVEEIGIGEDYKIVETSDCILRLEVDWCEVK